MTSIDKLDPIQWLERNEPDFREVSDEHRQSIFHFLLLWSLFERRALGTEGNATKICDAVLVWSQKGRLNNVTFKEALAYFKERYFDNGQETTHFKRLQLRKSDKPQLVRDVLNGINLDPVNVVTVLIIIAYRLRNNLFHGTKWASSLNGQSANFDHANAILIHALEHQNSCDEAFI